MIAEFIVITSVLLAALFGIAWLLLPSFRRRIEAPKYDFQQHLQAYNRQIDFSRHNRNEAPDEPD
jgi:hypothetical protein